MVRVAAKQLAIRRLRDDTFRRDGRTAVDRRAKPSALRAARLHTLPHSFPYIILINPSVSISLHLL
jgi:hypothetical protein